MAMGQVFFPATMGMTPLYFNGKAEPKTLSENQQVAWCPTSLLFYHTQFIEILISIGPYPVILKKKVSQENSNLCLTEADAKVTLLISNVLFLWLV